MTRNKGLSWSKTERSIFPYRDLIFDHPCAASFLTALVLVGLHLLFFRPFFQSNDNIFKVFFAKGIGFSQGPSEFIAFSNVLLGFALKKLYGMAPHIQWFGWTLIVTQFLSLWGLVFSLFLSRRDLLNALFLLLTFLCVECRYFSELQFTITASLAAQASVLLLMTVLRSKDREDSKAALFLFFGLSLMGSLVRFSAYVLNLALLAPFIGWTLWEHKKEVSRPVRWACFSTLLLTVCWAGFNEYWYQRDPGWKEFNRFDAQRLAFMDYRISRYDGSTKPIFESVHWTQNDYEMFKDWCYFDPVRYSAENLQKLAGSFPQIGAAGKNDSIGSLSDIFFSPFCQTIFLYTILFALFHRRGSFHLLGIQFLWILSILVFLMFFFRAPERLYEPAFFALLGLAVLFADPEGPGPVDFGPSAGLFRKFRIGLLVLGCLLVVPSLRSYLRDNQRRIENEGQYRSALIQLHPQPNQLFVVWASSLVYEQIDALDDYEIYRPFHFFSLAVYQRGPVGDAVLKRYGIKDPFRDMVNNKDIFLICSMQEGLYYTRYMEEKYHLKVRARAVFHGPNFTVYQIST